MDTGELSRGTGTRILSEAESREILEAYGIPLVECRQAAGEAQAVEAARELGYPVVLKGTGRDLAHKTESGVVCLDLRNASEVRRACRRISRRAGDRLQGLLVQRMIASRREFICGMRRDPQFGPCVMFGLGGIFTEALGSVSFRVAPLDHADAADMLTEPGSAALLGAFRKEPATDRGRLAAMLTSLGKIGLEQERIAEIDLNPVMLDGPRPVAVDALVVLGR